MERQGTMQATAEEGIQYLKESGKDDLIKRQGLDDKNSDSKAKKSEADGAAAPAVEKSQTMAATAKEGEQLLESMGGAPDGKTRAQQKELGNGEEKKEDEKEEVPSKKPKLNRDSTMAATAKEGEQLVGEVEELGGTRSGTEAIKKAEDETVPAPKKTQTMEATSKEAEGILEGEQKGGTRSETAAAAEAAASTPAPAPKRSGTMQQTAKEGQDFVDGKKDWE